jgi:tetratricopeptide (TPR) repeat protein
MTAQAWFEKGMKAIAREVVDRASLESAVAAFDEALGLEPDHLGALRERAFALAQLGQYEAALDSFVAAAAQAKDDPELCLAVGQSLVKLQRHEEALKSFEQVLALRPSDEAAGFGRAATLMALGDFEKALAAWEAVLAAPASETFSLHGREVRGLTLVRRAHARLSCALALGRLERAEAFAAFRQCIEAEVDQLAGPSSRNALLGGVSKLEVARPAFRWWLEAHRAGELWFEAQRNAEAIAAWDVLTPFAKAWFDKAEADAQAGEPSVAIYAYERSLDLWPGFPAAMTRMKAVQAQRDGGRWAVMSHDAYAREDHLVGEFATKAQAEKHLAQLKATQDDHCWVVPLT